MLRTFLRTAAAILTAAALAGCASTGYYAGNGNNDYTMTSFSTVNSIVPLGRYTSPNVVY